MKTLYMTDLDGTLLRPDQTISPRSVEILNRLAGEGCLFSVCTARSLIGLQMLNLEQVHFTAPMVLMNGAMVYDFARKKVVDQAAMAPAVVAHVLAICARHGKNPFVYRVEGDRVLACYPDLRRGTGFPAFPSGPLPRAVLPPAGVRCHKGGHLFFHAGLKGVPAGDTRRPYAGGTGGIQHHL